jgi:hypothetical protein
MSDPAPERIAATFDMTVDDYERYALAVDRRGRSWLTFYISIAPVLAAIPVALLFRWLASQHLDDPDAIDIVGEYSLFSFCLAILATWIGLSVNRQILRNRYFKTTMGPPAQRTAELDHTGVAVISKGARAIYEWTMVPRCTFEQSLLLIWISQSSAVAIPSRCFGSEAACKAALAFVCARLSEARAKTAPPQTADAPTPAS